MTGFPDAEVEVTPITTFFGRNVLQCVAVQFKQDSSGRCDPLLNAIILEEL